MPVQLRISRAQDNEPRLGRGLPVEEPHQAQATLQRLVPHHGGLQGQRRLLCSWAEVLAMAQGWEGNLPSIGASCPTALRVRSGGEQHAVGIAP